MNFWKSGDDYIKVTFHRRESYHTDVTFKNVLRVDAENALEAHQKGNGGPVKLHLSGGGKASIDPRNFVAIELGA